ncbi:MAG: single-stranded DNA-binding protein [Spirochaetes bacterium]|jgi:single-strand DNA-binding protein|nr:single-stranded DNA-binding protein [Spirochaetota bacterium]
MAGDINRITLIGRLTKEPELRYTQGGAAIGNFSIANNRSYSTNTGEKKDEVSYFDCVAWGKLGEIIVEHCKKGRRIAIEGRLQQRRWEDKEGGKRSKIEIVVENFQFLDAKSTPDASYSSDQSAPETHSAPPEDHYQTSPGNENNPFSDDDIPF